MKAATQQNYSKKINRSLLTFAFVSQRLTKTNDYMQSLAPLFVPIIEDMNGKVFETAEFIKRVSELYGLKISADVVEEFIPRLQREGLLTTLGENTEQGVYICCSQKKFDD